jgi:predicted acetyltransferase
VQFTTGQLTNDADLERFAELACDAFNFPTELFRANVDVTGREHLRGVFDGKRLVGGLVLLPMGQFFGGRSVNMTGVAAVATAPEVRARGAASLLLRDALHELREQEVALSALYPATVSLYRRAGYEIAGLDYEVAISLKGIDVRDRALPVRQASEADEAEIRNIYTEWALGTNGNLDRNEFNWKQIREPRGRKATPFIVTEDDRMTGYAYVLTDTDPDGTMHLWVRDCATLTPAATRRLLAFFADYRTTRGDLRARLAPLDPIMLHLGQAIYTYKSRTPWMLRIVNLPLALTERGYAPGVSGEIHLRIRDDILLDNDGDWFLQVADGHCEVTRGGHGTLELDVRGLAALYTGSLSAEDIALGGMGSGSEHELAVASSLFSGSTPWMRDDF